MFLLLTCFSYADCLGEDAPGAMKCDEGYASITDMDADAVPDLYDMCQNTAPGELVDERQHIMGVTNAMHGCSASQGAEYVSAPQGGKPGHFRIPDLLRLPCWGVPDHCCNGILDFDELGVDCGGSCKPCKGSCTKIMGMGGLGVVLVPIGYSSSKYPEKDAFYWWKNRAYEEAIRLSSTAPFSLAKMTFYRLDHFKPHAALTTAIISSTGDILSYKSQLAAFCPDGDLVYFLPIFPGRSFAFGSANTAVIFPDPENAITHETGHALCGLNDEYVSQQDAPSFGGLPAASLNCDANPFIYELMPTGNYIFRPAIPGEYCDGTRKICICKWSPLHPAHALYEATLISRGLLPKSYPYAGCTPGCYYNQFYYRPEVPYTDSMMNGNMPIGIPTWNQIGLDVCSQVVNWYA